MSDTPKIVHINRQIVDIKPEPDPVIVDQLKKMLAMAEAGTLQGLFAVGWNTDNSITSGWQGAEKCCFTLLGGIEQCKQEYILREFERRK